MEMQFNEKEEVLIKKVDFYFTLNLKCHIKLKPTGFLNGKFTSQLIMDGRYFMFQDLRKNKSERLFLYEIFDIKDYEEPVNNG